MSDAHIGQRIRRYRRIVERTQAEVAKACGHHAPWLCAVEAGHINPTPHDIKKIASALGVHASVFETERA